MTGTPNKNTKFNSYKEQKIINIESIFSAIFLGYYIIGLKFHWGLAVLAGLGLIIGLKTIFHFKVGYLVISILFSAFWAYCFSSGWFCDGNWIMTIVVATIVFVASLAAHKMNYEENN